MTVSHRIDLRAQPGLHYVYSGRSLLVCGLSGLCCDGTEGFFVENTRVLSRLEARAGGQPLFPVAASPVSGDGLMAYLEVMAGPTIPGKAVYVEYAAIVAEGMRASFKLTNYAINDRASFEFAVHLDSDFTDSEVVEGRVRDHGMGTGDKDAIEDDGVETTWDDAKRELTFRYRQEQLDRALVVRVEEAPGDVRFEDGALVVDIDLAPHESASLRLAVEPGFDGRAQALPRASFAERGFGLESDRRGLRGSLATLTSTNQTVSQAWETATLDLATLPLGLEPGPLTPIAGLPLYQQFFGRDSLTIGWQSLVATPLILRDALRLNAAWQGAEVNNWLDEEPGKLIHQARWGPRSLLGLDPFIRYYGDYSAPQDFVAMLGEYYAWSGDGETVRSLLPAAKRCLDWLERYGDLDDDGFLEYVTRSEKGVKNQGWKDSGDAIIDVDGVIIENPIASSDLQCYWYSALMEGALTFFAQGERSYAWSLQRKARDLKKRFHEAYWMEDEGFYAMALGPDKKKVRSLSSNTGHMLASGVAPPEVAKRVAQRMLEPDFFSGWGIRTIPSSHKAYNPFSYHRGSVWPIESGVFAFGFAQYGLFAELEKLAKATFDSTALFTAGRLPEVLSGITRDGEHPHPGVYPGSCEPQGWSAGAIVLTIQAMLGMKGIAPLGLLFVDPHLPEWLPDLKLEGVRVGGSLLDIEFKREDSGKTDYRVKRREGHARVLRQPPPGQEGINVLDRALAALTSLPRS